MLELIAHFQGRVQGVGFRYIVKRHAESLALKGFACNLEDGSVEVRAVGDKGSLEAFLDLIQQKPGFAKIDKVDVSYVDAKKRYEDFRVLSSY